MLCYFLSAGKYTLQNLTFRRLQMFEVIVPGMSNVCPRLSIFSQQNDTLPQYCVYVGPVTNTSLSASGLW